MGLDQKSTVTGDLRLAGLDAFIDELLDSTTFQTYQVVVVTRVVEFENGLVRLEAVSLQQTRLLELGEHPVDRSQTDINTVAGERPVDVLSREMPHRRPLEQFENPYARQCGF